MRSTPQLLPKLLGADMELANFISGLDSPHGTGYQASRALLREVEGFEGRSLALSQPGIVSLSGFDSQDWGRKFLRNGGCVYIDLNHLELCTPENLLALDHVASVHAMYRVARLACESANHWLPEHQRIRVLALNSDGQSNSFGSHLNVLITRTAWENIFCRKIQFLGFLASFNAAALVICGLGKVGSENGLPQVRYQCSQRADFLERIQSLTTTISRGILNTRNEPLCGLSYWDGAEEAAQMARLHVICFDANLCHVGGLLKAGGLQIACAMLEAGCLEPRLILEDPVQALRDWSHDPALQATATLVSGERINVVDWQRRFFDFASPVVQQLGLNEFVPQAEKILELWHDTLDKLARGCWEQVTGRLDWVLKRAILEQAMAEHRLAWDAPAVKHLDQLYSDLEDAHGLYWAYERAGIVERLLSEPEIRRREFEPPENTRAWTRGALLGLARPEQIHSVDWDHIRFSLPNGPGWSRKISVRLANPLDFTRARTTDAFPPNGDLGRALEVLSCGEPAVPENEFSSSNLKHSNHRHPLGDQRERPNNGFEPQDKSPNE